MRRGSRWVIAAAALAVLGVVAVGNLVTRPAGQPATLAEAVRLTVSGVGSSTYAVTADLAVRNLGPSPLSVVGVSSAGVAISARGGLPERVPARGVRTLPLHLEIPGCARLPARIGGFDVAVERGSERASVGYLSEPGTPLYGELAALADRICAPYRRR